MGARASRAGMGSGVSEVGGFPWPVRLRIGAPAQRSAELRTGHAHIREQMLIEGTNVADLALQVPRRRDHAGRPAGETGEQLPPGHRGIGGRPGGSLLAVGRSSPLGIDRSRAQGSISTAVGRSSLLGIDRSRAQGSIARRGMRPHIVAPNRKGLEPGGRVQRRVGCGDRRSGGHIVGSVLRVPPGSRVRMAARCAVKRGFGVGQNDSVAAPALISACITLEPAMTMPSIRSACS
jgi:hypothetical protein